MALCLRKSRDVVGRVKSKLGLLGTWSSTATDHGASFTAPCARFSNPVSNSTYRASLFSFRRFGSITALSQLDAVDDVADDDQTLDFPGGKVKFTSELSFIPESLEERVQCYRVLDDHGQPVSHNNLIQVGKEVGEKMYKHMVMLQTMDTIFYELQRQGRLSFYLTTNGEEAINIASAAALAIDDIIFSQYRESGVLLWRGFTIEQFANQLFGNEGDHGKGRQMPVHYGSKELNFVTISSPLATQIIQAVGAAYSLKMEEKDACAVAYFGEGAASEGDFHAALNFAAVMEVPVVFICRNNGWAISTPISDQFRSDGIVVKGQAYGIRSIRVDGNDALAVYGAVQAARTAAIKEQRPILIEALTYRVSHHSTSDDSTKYRAVDEIEHWRVARDPVARFRKWMESNAWWSSDAELEIRSNVRHRVLDAIKVAEKVVKPPVADLFTDVYDIPSSNLEEQERLLRETITRYPQDYPKDVPL